MPAGSIASWSILAFYHAPAPMPVAAINAVFVILHNYVAVENAQVSQSVYVLQEMRSLKLIRALQFIRLGSWAFYIMQLSNTCLCT